MGRLAPVVLTLSLACGACASVGPPPGPQPSAAPGVAAAPVHHAAALAAYLTRDAHTDTDKARAIFRWLADNIAYDEDAIGVGEAVRPESVLAARKAVCDGYAGAFALLGRLAGLRVEVVRGWAKGYGWMPGTHFHRPNHAWNAVLLDGQWRLVDATWGAGYVRDGRFVKQLDDFYFLPPAEALAFTHLPEDPIWTLVPGPLSLEAFEAQPVVSAAFFRAGFTAAEARAALASAAAPPLPDVFLSPDQPIRFRTAPVEGVLTAGRSYRFEAYAPAGVSMAVVNAGRWRYFVAEGGVLATSVMPDPGSLYVAVRTSDGNAGYRTVLRYRAR